MVSTWMGDHSRVRRRYCSYKYCKIPGAEKRGPHYMLLGQKRRRKRDCKSLLPTQFRRWGVREARVVDLHSQVAAAGQPGVPSKNTKTRDYAGGEVTF